MLCALCSLRRPEEEELRRFAEYGYYSSSVERLSGYGGLYTDDQAFPERLIKVLGAVPDPSYAGPQLLGPLSCWMLLALGAAAMAGATAWRVAARRRWQWGGACTPTWGWGVASRVSPRWRRESPKWKAQE